MKNNLKIIASLLPVSLFINSCGTDANLAKVRKFSENAGAIELALPVIADDFYKSCLRAARYEPVNILPSEKKNDSSSSVIDKQIFSNEKILSQVKNINKKLEDQAPGSQVKKDLEKLEQKLAANPSIADPLQARRDAQKECNKKRSFESSSEEQVPRIYLGSLMKNGNSIIVLYMKKLGMLASDDLINFDNEFNSLSTNLTSLEGKLADLLKFTAEDKAKITKKTTAGFNIANFIVNQIFEGERVETLNEAIPLANEPLKNYAEGLQTVAERVYINQYLKNEESFLDDYYIEYISEILESNERKQGDSVINIANTLIAIDQDRWNPEKDKIQERRELAFSYINLLKTVVDGHEELATIYNNGEQPSGDEINKAIETNNKAVKDFIDKAKALQKSTEQKN